MISKNLIFSLLIIGYSTLVAQIDRSKAPISNEIPSINFGKTQQFTLKNGLKVIVVENHKLPIVRINLDLNLPPIYEADKAGINSMFGDMIQAGTIHYTKEQIDEKIDFLGSSLYAFTNGIRLSSLKNKLAETLELANEIMYHPTFSNQKELDRLKKEYLESIEVKSKSADYISSRAINVLLYGEKHPYGEYPTQETLKNISLEDFRNMYKANFTANESYLTIVGDITLSEAKKITKKYFSALPNIAKNISLPTGANPITKTEIDIIDLPTASQSVISIVSNINLKMKDEKYISASIGNAILGKGANGRLFKNIREDKGWTYGAYSTLNDDKYGLGNFKATASVRNNVTDSAVVEMMAEIKRILSEPVTTDELKRITAEKIGKFSMSFEEPETTSSLLLKELKEGLPEGYYQNYLNTISKVNTSSIQKTLASILSTDNMRIIIVGKADEIVPNLKKLPYPINFFDTNGKPVADPTINKEVSTKVTALSIINDYINKIGGREKLQTIKNISSTYTADLQGMSLKIQSIRALPNKLADIITLPTAKMTISKIVFDGENGYEENPESKTIFPKEKIEILKKENSVFPQLEYKDDNIELKGIVTIDNRDTYEIKNGDKLSYYDTQTKLLVREITKEKIMTELGEMDQSVIQNFKNYKEYNGILLPYTIESIIPDTPLLIANLIDVQFNTPLENAKFK